MNDDNLLRVITRLTYRKKITSIHLFPVTMGLNHRNALIFILKLLYSCSQSPNTVIEPSHRQHLGSPDVPTAVTAQSCAYCGTVYINGFSCIFK